MIQVTKNIEILIDEGAEITLGGSHLTGALPRPSTAATASPFSCVAIA